ncbi:MAG: ATP-binding protein [Spirochaetaceae bacterium]
MKKNPFLSFLYIGCTENSGLKERSRSAVLSSISLISVIILITFTVVDIIEESYLISIFTGITAITITISIILVGITKKLIIGTTYVSYIAFTLFALLIFTSGSEKAGYFWIMLFPLVSIFFLGIIHGSILTLIFGILAYFLIFKITGLEALPVNVAMGGRAIGAYIGVTLFTVAFELIRIQAFNKLEQTSDNLVAKRRQTTMILNNVKQGIFLLDENLNLADERSTYFNNLFGSTTVSHSFMELIKGKLPQRDYIATKDYLELFYNKTVNPTLLTSINPIEKVLMNFDGENAEKSQVWLEFNFERILLKNGEIQILGLFKDVTTQVLLEERLTREENESLKNMESLFQIIHVNPELMEEFLKDSHDEISIINDFLKVETNETSKLINHIFASVHSIKGNAMLLGLKTIANKLKDFEDYIKELRNTKPTWRELLKLTVNLADLKHDLDGINVLIEKIIAFKGQAGGEIKNKKYIFEESLKKSLVRLGVEYNRELELDVTQYDNKLIPEKYRRLFKDSINQFVRNSVAHGIEDVEERFSKGKEPTGKIFISLKKKENVLEFIYRDDGRGLNLNKIVKSAIKKDIITVEIARKLKSSDAVKLIFNPGFSTVDDIDNLAGQGVGMNVIKNYVDNAGGKLNIKSSVGKFCEFRILLKA